MSGPPVGECCATMRQILRASSPCLLHGLQCPEIILRRVESGAIGIVVHDGGTSVLEIKFCPWCGAACEPMDMELDPEEQAKRAKKGGG